MVWGGVGGRLERGNICTHMADSHCCTAETNATLTAIIIQLKIIFQVYVQTIKIKSKD